MSRENATPRATRHLASTPALNASRAAQKKREEANRGRRGSGWPGTLPKQPAKYNRPSAAERLGISWAAGCEREEKKERLAEAFAQAGQPTPPPPEPEPAQAERPHTIGLSRSAEDVANPPGAQTARRHRSRNPSRHRRQSAPEPSSPQPAHHPPPTRPSIKKPLATLRSTTQSLWSRTIKRTARAKLTENGLRGLTELTLNE
ncbi:unnamed protein product [Bursaphelenchus okinawaensis]|uniref:Uncharacterized protein n=1 Tax=Bursaphelenchus okinawaensis TaxID=465554 RepID=A0A811JWP7_9BILA|nr:unnamed protein product [Bursaphelenchus okinawaensis]CAG9086328.1 unnamed protein product [Bursaphelenchus okinawaensis]